MCRKASLLYLPILGRLVLPVVLIAVQGRGSLKSELQRKESDLGRALAAQDAQAALIDELKAAGDKAAQVRSSLLGAVELTAAAFVHQHWRDVMSAVMPAG